MNLCQSNTIELVDEILLQLHEEYESILPPNLQMRKTRGHDGLA
jgi:hypothetical protein